MHYAVKTLIFVAVILLNCMSALASPVTINWSSVKSVARDGAVSSGYVEDVYTGLGYTTHVTAATQSASSATTTTDWQDAGTSASFDFSFNHVRGGAEGSYATSYERSLFFTAMADADYSLAGFYGLTGSDAIYADIWLADITVGFESSLFRDTAYSIQTENEFFLLGDIGDGDNTNVNIGNLAGQLVSGHQYRFTSSHYIQLLQGPDGGASASGNLNLTVSIPAPDTLPLVLSALLCLGFLSHRRIVSPAY
jgi:hypothetical protein